MPFPTPKDLSGRPRPSTPVTPATPATPAPPPAPPLSPAAARRARQLRNSLLPPLEQQPGHADFDPAAYEHLLRRAGLHRHAVTVGCLLTGYALPDGRLTRVLTNSQIATATGVDRGYVTTTLREMQRQGWISRPAHADSRDTRSRPITLTIPAHPQEPTP